MFNKSIAKYYIAKIWKKVERLISLSRPSQSHWETQWIGLSYVGLPALAKDENVDPGPWFDEVYYNQQKPNLSALSRERLLQHYRKIGWKEGIWPHPFFNPGFYFNTCINNNRVLRSDPLTDWLSGGLEAGLSPSPLFDLPWLVKQIRRGASNFSISLATVHPWGAAAEAVGTEQLNPCLAPELLGRWIKEKKIYADEKATLLRLPLRLFQLPDWPPKTAKNIFVCIGCQGNNWQTHALLQHFPIPLKFEDLLWFESLDDAIDAHGSEDLCILHAQDIDETVRQGTLAKLAGILVFDPSPKNVEILRRLGVDAHQLVFSEHNAQSTFLDIDLANNDIQSDLGLPSPVSFTKNNDPPSLPVVCLGSAGTRWERQLDGSCWCLPGFHALSTPTPAHARKLAAWLQACQLAGVQLVELLPPANPLPVDGFAALAQPDPVPPGWLPVQRFQAEITPAELQAELIWRRQGCPPPPPCTTPSPSHRSLWQHRSQAPIAAVCVSLYNYASRIEAALQSVHSQTLEAVELIVVDDASSDGSSAVVQAWLERHGDRFARALLLQHEVNGGLAATRNTAFAAAEAPWCFVLDADNHLLPTAVAQCLAVADCATATTAVVHPLVALAYERPDPYPRALLSHQSWQRDYLRTGNYVDAMALVRRSAWQQVGGYTHIPGGWEDFDFWCTLIDAGLHGVLCPQRLAVYTVHTKSMAAIYTRRLERPLSRLLQHRHPWLRLPLAAEAPSTTPAAPA